MLTLDVLIPSHNRSVLVQAAARSVLNATEVSSLRVRVTVVLNGCTDDSRERMLAMQAVHGNRLLVVEERRLGKSRALNAGIAATRGDLVGMIDDDEEVNPDWLQVIAREFADDSIDFIGGPYRPRWTSPPPDWLPTEYLAALGGTNSGDVARDFGPDFPAILKGGNAVIRRRALERAGPYAEYLGPGPGGRLFSCEDEEMFLRLLKLGARGRYVPDLLIHHHIFADRLTPEYFRRWCFWRGVSRGLMDRRHPLPVRYLAGVPRFMYGEVARKASGIFNAFLYPKRRPHHLSDELRFWDLAGYFWGKNIYPLGRFLVRSRRKAGPSVAIYAADADELEERAV